MLKPKFIYAGWSSKGSPNVFANWLMGRSETITYEEFEEATIVETCPLEDTGFAKLPITWRVTFLRTELLSGKPAYLLRYNDKSYLFLLHGDDYKKELTKLDDIVEWAKATHSVEWLEDLSEEQVEEMRKLFFPSGEG